MKKLARLTWLVVAAVPLGCGLDPEPGPDPGGKEELTTAALSSRETTFTVWRPSTGVWWDRTPAQGDRIPGMGAEPPRPAPPTTTATAWGTAGDVPLRMDGTGDGAKDHVVWRPSDGTWYVRGGAVQKWGVNGDIPVPGDYDNDGADDFAVWRPSTGVWWILNNRSKAESAFTWGIQGDHPAPGDYDGDGRTDHAVWRPSNGRWYVKLSGGGAIDREFGTAGDWIAQGDYDGDRKFDLAIWRPSTGVWWVLRSGDGGISTTQWGANGDVPVPISVDTNATIDPTVWRPSNGRWYSLVNGQERSFDWGTNGDMPLGNRRPLMPPGPKPPAPPPDTMSPPTKPPTGGVVAFFYLPHFGAPSCGTTKFQITDATGTTSLAAGSGNVAGAPELDTDGKRKCRYMFQWLSVRNGPIRVYALSGVWFFNNGTVTGGQTTTVHVNRNL